MKKKKQTRKSAERRSGARRGSKERAKRACVFVSFCPHLHPVPIPRLRAPPRLKNTTRHANIKAYSISIVITIVATIKESTTKYGTYQSRTHMIIAAAAVSSSKRAARTLELNRALHSEHGLPPCHWTGVLYHDFVIHGLPRRTITSMDQKTHPTASHVAAEIAFRVFLHGHTDYMLRCAEEATIRKAHNKTLAGLHHDMRELYRTRLYQSGVLPMERWPWQVPQSPAQSKASETTKNTSFIFTLDD